MMPDKKSETIAATSNALNNLTPSQLERVREITNEKLLDFIHKEWTKAPLPYPFCRNRARTQNPCAGKGYCPEDPACND